MLDIRLYFALHNLGIVLPFLYLEGGTDPVAAALAAGRYSYVVLQERGGDFACGFGPDVCANSRASLITLAELGRSNDAIPILLGTCQGNPQASRRIVEAESRAAQEAGVDYISISESGRRSYAPFPTLRSTN